MTADRLARHYPSLKPDERLALLLAAAGRGDDVEHERLTAAAPRVSFTTLHTFPRAVAFRELLDRFRAERLDLAARYFQARLEAAGDRGGAAGRVTAARIFGYLLRISWAGWAAFCEREMLPSCGLEVTLVGGGVLATAEAEADADGVTAGELGATAAAVGLGPIGPVRTVDSIAAELAEAFASRLAWWEGEGR